MSLILSINATFAYYNATIPLSLARNESGDSEITLNLNGYAACADSSFDEGWFVEYFIVGSSFGGFNFDTDSLTDALSSMYRIKAMDLYGYASYVGGTVLGDVFNASFMTGGYGNDFGVDCEGDRACLKSVFGFGLELDDIISIINSSLSDTDLHTAINAALGSYAFVKLDCGAVMSCAFGVVTLHSGKGGTGHELVSTISDYYDSVDATSGYVNCDKDCHANVTLMVENYIENEITNNDVKDFAMYDEFTFDAATEFDLDADGLFSFYNGIFITGGIGGELNGDFQAEFAGYGGKIYCLPNDYCNIKCETVLACWMLELICYEGSTCHVECSSDQNGNYPNSYCPIGWNGTGKYINIQKASFLFLFLNCFYSKNW